LSLLFFLITTAAWGIANTITGNWAASVMGSVIKAQVQQTGKTISGVAHIYNPFGHRDTYHFSGNIENGRVNAQHHDGHNFSGNLTHDGQIVGTVKTRGGHKFNIVARRD